MGEPDALEIQTMNALRAGSVFHSVFDADLEQLKLTLDHSPELIDVRGALGETLLHLVGRRWSCVRVSVTCHCGLWRRRSGRCSLRRTSVRMGHNRTHVHVTAFPFVSSRCE